MKVLGVPSLWIPPLFKILFISYRLKQTVIPFPLFVSSPGLTIHTLLKPFIFAYFLL
jgi:hypothetical protein